MRNGLGKGIAVFGKVARAVGLRRGGSKGGFALGWLEARCPVWKEGEKAVVADDVQRYVIESGAKGPGS